MSVLSPRIRGGLGVPGACCARCGRPCDPDTLVRQDGVLVCPRHVFAHARAELERGTAGDRDDCDAPLGATFGGRPPLDPRGR